jgi:hypothetical protein
MNHRLVPPTATHWKAPAQQAGNPPAWPSYKGTSQLIGVSASGRATVYVDPTIGAAGADNARDLVNDADRVANANDAVFGTTGGPVSVIVFALGGATDGTGGADHGGCDYVSGAAIEVCASFGNSARVSALFEAELSECSMGSNLCGVSTGEALSRWCAAVIGANSLADFATAPQWVRNGMKNYVNQTAPTDQDPDSTGCGMAFLSWLRNQGFGLEKIAPAMVSLGDQGTLAQLYTTLTGQPVGKAWPTFLAAVKALPAGVTNDDPFGGATRTPHLAQFTPATVELVEKVFSAIVADVVKSKYAHERTGSVRAALTATRKSQSRPVTSGKAGSRRLRRSTKKRH